MVTAAPLSLASMPRAYADAYDDQKTALQSQITQYQDQAGELGKQVANLQAQLTLLYMQKKQISAQLALTQTSYDKLTTQINATKTQIKANRDALGQVIAQLYVDSQTSSLEMLASSQNIGTYIDKQTYQNSMQASLKTTIKKIEKLQKILQKQQAAVKVTLDKQKAQQNNLAAKIAQQNALVADTQGRQDAYEQLVSATQSQLQSISAQQQSYYNSVKNSAGGGSYGVHGSFSYSNWSGNQGCGGGYPYCASQDSMTDLWGLYNRECVSYVAWSLANRYHRYVGNFSGHGNAGEWPDSAVQYSGAKIVADPQPGDAVILPATADDFAPVGHAMIVDSVNGDKVHVSQFNFYGTGEYSTMDIGTGGVIFLRFPAQ